MTTSTAAITIFSYANIAKHSITQQPDLRRGKKRVGLSLGPEILHKGIRCTLMDALGAYPGPGILSQRPCQKHNMNQGCLTRGPGLI